MDPFTAAMLAGTALQMYGNYKSNMDEAAAEAENEMWMREQAAWIEKSTQRELGIYDRESKNQMASMENAFAKSGISMEGSALAVRQQEELMRLNELDAIRDQGNMQLREAYLKIGASGKKQAALTSTFGNFTQGAAIGISGASAARSSYMSEKNYAANK
jgi:hypothetical protein